MIDICPRARYRGDKFAYLSLYFSEFSVFTRPVSELAEWGEEIHRRSRTRPREIIHPDAVVSKFIAASLLRVIRAVSFHGLSPFPAYTCLGKRSYKLKERAAGPRVKTIRFILAATLSRDDQNIIVLCTPCSLELSPWNSKYM